MAGSTYPDNDLIYGCTLVQTHAKSKIWVWHHNSFFISQVTIFCALSLPTRMWFSYILSEHFTHSAEKEPPNNKNVLYKKKNQIGKKDAINSYGRHAKSYYWAHDVLMLNSSILLQSKSLHDLSWIECQKSNLSNNACWAFEHFIIFIYLWFDFGQPHYI